MTASGRSLTKPFCTGTGLRHLRNTAVVSRAHSRRQLSAMAQATYDIWVKGSPEKNELGDCPFSHRMMLSMEEKGISYHKNLLDEMKMPDWIKDVCEGQKQIPFMKENESGKWLYDSDKMAPYLEDKFPDKKKLGKQDELPQVGKSLFPDKFMAFMTSEPGADEDKKKQDLLEELQSVNEFLEKSGKPYFGGDDVNALDMSMAPKIKHIKIGADEVKSWQVPSDLKALHSWMGRMSERDSWKKTYYTEQYVRDGWNLKVKMQKEQS